MKKILPSLILIVLLAGVVFYAQMRFNTPKIPPLYPVPAFEFKAHTNDMVSEKDLSGKITVANFIFTTCPGICPVMTKKMKVLYDTYKDEENIKFLSFSVDPAIDSLEALQAYAERYEISDARWKLLRTDVESITKLYEEGFKLGGELPYGHSGAFVLIDENGFIRGYYNYDDDNSIKILNKHLVFLNDAL